MKQMFSTKEVAQYLLVNEKMIYTLIGDKGLPATKITGKWMFPAHLVDQWIEQNTINYPQSPYVERASNLIIVAGSNDLLLERTISLFMSKHPEYVVAFSNLGSLGGLKALRDDICQMASSHLMQGDADDFNFEFAAQELDQAPAVLNFCRREQGLLVPKGNPHNITCVADIAAKKLRMINRPLGTGTRLLLDKEIVDAGTSPDQFIGYDRELQRHFDVGLEILSGQADTGPAIRAVADLLSLDFVPIHWERFDLLINKNRFFDKGLQAFVSFFNTQEFQDLAQNFAGYDTSNTGAMMYPKAVEQQA